jgi:hypothetical protein
MVCVCVRVCVVYQIPWMYDMSVSILEWGNNKHEFIQDKHNQMVWKLKEYYKRL